MIVPDCDTGPVRAMHREANGRGAVVRMPSTGRQSSKLRILPAACWHHPREQRAGHADFATTQIYLREAENLAHGFGTVFPPLPAGLLTRPIRARRVSASVSAFGFSDVHLAGKTRWKQSGRLDSNPVDTSAPCVADGRVNDAVRTTQDDARRREVSALWAAGDRVEAALGHGRPCRVPRPTCSPDRRRRRYRIRCPAYPPRICFRRSTRRSWSRCTCPCPRSVRHLRDRRRSGRR